MTLSTLLTYIRALLGDEDALRFSETLLTQAVRICLAEINLAAGQSYSLSGLDGGTLTSLPEGETQLLAIGAAGCAVRALNIRRADQHPLDEPVTVELTRLAAQLDARFSAALEVIRRRGLATSDQPPYAAIEPADSW